jgi:hypothetical protein
MKFQSQNYFLDTENERLEVSMPVGTETRQFAEWLPDCSRALGDGEWKPVLTHARNMESKLSNTRQQ